MKTRKIKVSAQKVDELIEMFSKMPDAPKGNHLSDDEAIGYAMESLSLEEVQRVDEHLASCAKCSSDIERLLDVSSVWCGEQGESRVEQFSDRLVAAMQSPPNSSESENRAGASVVASSTAPSMLDLLKYLDTQLANFLFLVGMAKSTQVVAKTPPTARRWIQVDDDDTKLFRCVINPEANGNLTFRFSSHLLAENVRLRLIFEAPNWEGREEIVTLKRVASDQVGERVVITKDERKDWPSDAVGKIKPVL